jgi:lipid-A-disaccharide synthase
VTATLLVVAGEASGDRAAAGVLAALGSRVRAFGMGGDALSGAGLERVVPMQRTAVVGLADVALKGAQVLAAFGTLLAQAAMRRPAAALLVNYTEFNATLGPLLHARGVRVVWYAAPQVWAWRPARIHSFRRFVDAMAVVLPFEEPLWRDAGVDARYVGHPALEHPPMPRGEARRALGMTPTCAGVAILPGSRASEVRRLLPTLLEGYERVRRDRASVDGRVLVAASLDEPTRAWVEAHASEARVPCVRVDATAGAGPHLSAFDAALCAAGTASLEAALARAMPVVAYRVDRLTETVIRPLLRTPHVALPNVLLGQRVFPELLQKDVSGATVAKALGRVLDARSALGVQCARLEMLLRTGAPEGPSKAVAAMVERFLPHGARA